MRIFGREPALWLTLIAVIVKAVSAFVIDVSPEAQTWINTAAATGMGVVVAVVAGDSIGAALLSFAQAVLSLAVGFGLDWSTAEQAVALSVVTVLVGMFDRTQVVAPTPPPPA